MHRGGCHLQIPSLGQDTITQYQSHLVILLEGDFPVGHLTIFCHPHKHISLAGSQRRHTLLIGILSCHGIEFGIIVEFESNERMVYRHSIFIYDLDGHLTGWRIVIHHVDLRITRSLEHHLLRTIVMAEHLCMHQHTAGCTLIKPTQIKDGLRFTSTEEIPFTIGPRLYPRMVIIGMRPTGCIHLSCRDTDSSKGSNEEG